MSQTLRIETPDINNFTLYENNAIIHDNMQIAKFTDSIKQFCWTQPIIDWRDQSTISEHSSRHFAIKIGQSKVPFIIQSDLTKIDANTLRLADNRVTPFDYGMEIVSDEIQCLREELNNSKINLTLMNTGFD